MKVIGITGTSGSGKSTLSQIFIEIYHAYLIDADRVVKEMTYPNSSYLNAMIALFGHEILQEDGELDRKKLADLIYQDQSKREMLNACTTTYVVEEIKNRIKKQTEQECIVIDAPTLFECKAESICDLIIGVIANKEQKIERICKRDEISQEKAIARIQAQISDDFLKAHCDAIIYNNGSEREMKEQLQKIMKK